MTRENHLKFCKVCTHRDMDLKTGIICKLTGKIADFENQCPSYQKDEDYIAKMNTEGTYQRNDIVGRVSTKTLDKLRDEQSLPAAIFAGIFIGILAAIAWAFITVSTGFKIGLVAIAVGAAVGYGMRYFGKGIDSIYGICGAIIAFLSCFLGDFFSIMGFIAQNENVNLFKVFLYFDYSLTLDILKEASSFMDLVFYFIAGAEGYKFSFRQFSQKELHNLDHDNSKLNH